MKVVTRRRKPSKRYAKDLVVTQLALRVAMKIDKFTQLRGGYR